MKTCGNCGVSYEGYACSACQTRQTIKDENEKNRRQNEDIARHNANAQRLAAEQQQAMAEQQIYYAAAELNESKKRTKLIEEQAVTEQEAFDDGYRTPKFSSNFIHFSDPNFFMKTLI